MKSNLNQKGFSLVSVLVAIGMTGILSMILMNLSEQQNKQHKKAMIDGELAESIGNLRSIFANSESCTATLKDLKKGADIGTIFLSATDSVKYDENEDPKYAYAVIEGKTYGIEQKTFRGTKVYLDSLKILKDDEYPKNYTVQDGTILVRAEFRKRARAKEGETKKEILGGSFISKYFEVRVIYGRTWQVSHPVDKDGVVEKCKNINSNQRNFIQDEGTLLKAIPETAGVKILPGGGYGGTCVIEDSSDPSAQIIQCLTDR